MKRKLFIIICLLSIFTLIIYNYNTKSNNNYKFISFKDSVSDQDLNYDQTKREKPLRVAIASITSTKESIIYYKELLSLLEKEINRPIKIIQRKTYSEVNELLRIGEIDLAFICTYSYVSNHDSFGLELLVAPHKNGSAKYRSYIIVRQNSGLNNFVDLENKQFAFVDPMSTTGYNYPVSLLSKQGKKAEDYFSSYIFTYSHDNSIKAVIEGIVDAAAVDNMVYDYFLKINPQFKGSLKVIKESPKFTAPPVVVRPNLDSGIKAKLQKLFLELDKSSQGNNILNNMGLDGYKIVKDEDYDGVRGLGGKIE